MTVQPQIISCGFDALDLTLELDCSLSIALDSLFRRKTLAVDGITYAVLEDRPHTWNGLPKQRYLRCGYFYAGISRSIDRQTAWLRVQLRGAALQTKSLQEWHQRILKIVECLGLGIVNETVHGVDIRADLPGVSVRPFVRQLESDCLSSSVPRSNRRVDTPQEGQQCIHIGKTKSDVHATIYDEAHACKSQERERFIQACWGGSDPSYAARVEFQIGGECLRRRSIRTVHDLVTKLESLVRYLTGKYLRFTKKPPENRHSAPTWKHWRQIRYALIKWARVPQDIPKLNLPPRDRAREAQLASASMVGSLVRYAALIGARCESDEDLLAILRESLNGLNLTARIAQKCAELEISVVGTPCKPIGSPTNNPTRKRSKHLSHTGNNFD